MRNKNIPDASNTRTPGAEKLRGEESESEKD